MIHALQNDQLILARNHYNIKSNDMHVHVHTKYNTKNDNEIIPTNVSACVTYGIIISIIFISTFSLQIRAIDRKQEVPHDGPMCDLLWSDPEGGCVSHYEWVWFSFID